MSISYQTDITQTILSADGDSSLSISKDGLSLKKNLLTTPIETLISPLAITDINTGNVITMDQVTYLPIGLGALAVPSNITTCNFNNAIQLQDYNTTLAPPLVHSEVKLGANPLTFYGIQFASTETIATTISNDNGNNMNITADGTLTCLGNNLNLNANDNVSINATNDAITITADDNITLTSGGLGNIILNAPNIDSYSYAMPICFTRQRTDTFATGTTGGQNFDLIYQTPFNIPQEFVSISPMGIPLTSTNWKIDFAFNMFQVSTMGDKGMGIHIDFIDAASNVYTPITYNANTPYSIEKKDYGYASGGNAPYIPINWTDYVDLASLYNTGGANFPFDMRIWFAADGSGLTSNFNVLITLTRTNLL